MANDSSVEIVASNNSDSLAREVEQKNKTWWAGRFYEAYYGDSSILDGSIDDEALNLRKSFENWHEEVSKIFDSPQQESLGNEITAVKDLTFTDVVAYPSIEIASIDEKIARAQGDQPTISQLQKRRQHWEPIDRIAKKAFEASTTS